MDIYLDLTEFHQFRLLKMEFKHFHLIVASARYVFHWLS